MAENNSSAPLKTAEGAAPALPYPELWRDSKGIRGYTADPGQGPWFTADQMLAYAAQAVAAQAAPAAVAVPEGWRDFVIARLMQEDVIDHDGDGLYVCSGDARGLINACTSLYSATPAHPATEDSSAGDLAEVKIADEMSREERMIVLQRDSDGTPTVWCDPEIADIVCALNSGGVKTVASCSGHGVKPGGIALADGRQLLLLESLEAFNSAMSAITQAVVQAEPVIYVSRGQLDDFANPVHDGGHYLPVRRTPLGLLSYPLYTAPQAQPADALEPIRQVVRDYHYALDTRQHGGAATNAAVDAIEDVLGMHWVRDQEKDRRAAMAAAQEGSKQ